MPSMLCQPKKLNALLDRLFEEAEQDGSRKNEEIEAYKDTLARMRRELAATKAKVDADRAEKEREDELKEAERCALALSYTNSPRVTSEGWRDFPVGLI